MCPLSDYTPEQVNAWVPRRWEARRFSERKGFTVLERRDKLLRGVPIHNYRMAKVLG